MFGDDVDVDKAIDLGKQIITECNAVPLEKKLRMIAPRGPVVEEVD